MFFEHTKRQGGGPVKDVYLNKDDRIAVIEFEEASAVNAVLEKQPIVIQGTPVEVEIFTPYLDTGESLKSVEILGIQGNLTEDLAKVKLQQKSSADLFSSIPSHDIRSTLCSVCGSYISKQIVPVIFKCRDCSDFNLCWDCHLITKHDHFHILTFIEPGKNVLQSVHGYTRCDGCGQFPVLGARYKCTICLNFDFCSARKSSKKHDRKHDFVLIV